MRSRMSETVVVVGQGYVGLPLSVSLARHGFNVIGVDLDADRVAELRAGRSFTPDVNDEELLSLQDGAYAIHQGFESVPGFHFGVITVPTPLRDGEPDLSMVAQATLALAQKMTPGSTLILESTTYPGTSRELVIPIIRRATGMEAGRDYLLAYSPERIDPGNRDWNLQNTPKLVAGFDGASLKSAMSLYERVVDTVIPVDSLETAEMAKLIENTFRHVNIGLMNELAVFAHQMNVDIWKSIDAAASKPFGYMKFVPGVGVGGHCLPVDPIYLNWRLENVSGRKSEVIAAAHAANKGMPNIIARRVAKLVRESIFGDRKIILSGISYKKGTADVRESPSIELARELLNLGLEVSAIDSLVLEQDWPQGIGKVESSWLTSPSRASAFIILTHVGEELALGEHLLAEDVVFDLCNYMVDKPAVATVHKL